MEISEQERMSKGTAIVLVSVHNQNCFFYLCWSLWGY